MTSSGKLDTFSLAALLVGANYGLGFILGTAENSLTQGIGGSLYAVSTGLGLFALAGLAQFYWRTEQPIWTLLGDRYGSFLKTAIGMMSWMWMVGVVAAQILGGSFVLHCLGIPLSASMAAMAVLFATLSLLSVERVGQIFRGLLVLNSLIIFYALGRLDGFSGYANIPVEFVSALANIPISQQLGIVLTTVLLIPIGMQFQVFLVQAAGRQTAVRGCLLGGIALILLAFVPSEMTIAAGNSGILPDGISGKAIVPFVFSWLGGGIGAPMGIFLVLCLLFSALGSGSGLLRAMNQTLFELELLPRRNDVRIVVAIANVLLAWAIASGGGSIIGLMVSFYALYVAAVWVPFLAYLLDRGGRFEFTKTSIQFAVLSGGISGIGVLITTFAIPEAAIGGSQQLSILSIGMGFALLGLIFGQAIDKYATAIRPSKQS